MKQYVKLLMAAVTLFAGSAVMAQGKSGKTVTTTVSLPHSTSHNGKTWTKTKASNGTVQANAHASSTAQAHASDRSVLNRNSAIGVRTKTHVHYSGKKAKRS